MGYSPRRRRGMTLVELLIVISIIAVLLGIGVAVGYKFIGAGDDEKTKTRITITMNAILDYYDQNGAYPQTHSYTKDGKDYSLIKIPCTDTAGNELPLYKRFIDKLKALDSKAIQSDKITVSGDQTDAVFLLTDASQRVIQYFPDGALGGTPLLLSPGRDGKYRTDDGTSDEKKARGKDDIRSDK